MENQQQLNVKVDPSQTVAIISPEGKQVFTEGVLLRKVSKFLAGTAEDAIMPVPCFYDPTSGKILIEMLPKEFREEYQKYNDSL
jgi:hypothetical protein